MHGPGALHAGLLIRTLLQHYCQQQPVPLNWLRKPEQSGSLVLGLASKISLINLHSEQGLSFYFRLFRWAVGINITQFVF